MTQLTHGSLFAGIGGFDLGFERAGIKTVWQVEIDPFCRRVLEKNFPDARRYEDITRILPYELPGVDIVSGGFPCQDVSAAGKRSGIDGARTSLWREMLRTVRWLRPKYVVMENVSTLLYWGAGRIIGELAESGYGVEWDCLPAVAFGAPHRRDRVFIIGRNLDDAMRDGCDYREGGIATEPSEDKPQDGLPCSPGSHASRAETVANSDSESSAAGNQQHMERRPLLPARPGKCSEALADSEVVALGAGLCESESGEIRRRRLGDISSARNAWAVEPDVGRVAHGIPARVDRLKALGNAVVPQIAEWIGRRIVACHERTGSCEKDLKVGEETHG